MRRIFLVAVLSISVFAISNQAKAQAPAGKKLLNIAFESGFPIGNAADFYKVVLGGSLQGEFPISNQISFTGTTGYSTFTNGKEIEGRKVENSSFIPVKAGAKYYFQPKLYIIGELGAAFYTGNGSGTAFAYAPGIGYSFPVADNNFIDVSARFEGHSREGASYDFFGLRFAYAFGF